MPNIKFDTVLSRFQEIRLSLSLWYCCCSVTKSYPTLCDAMGCSTSGLPVPQHLPEFSQVHFHRLSDAIQPPHPLLPYRQFGQFYQNFKGM